MAEVPVEYDPWRLADQYAPQMAPTIGSNTPDVIAPRARPTTDVFPSDDTPAWKSEDVDRTYGQLKGREQQMFTNDAAESQRAREFLAQAKTNPQFQKPQARAALRYYESMHNYLDANSAMMQRMRGQADQPFERPSQALAPREPPNREPPNTWRGQGGQGRPPAPRPKPQLQRGAVVDGHVYLGGNPNDQSNWQAQQQR